MIPQRYHDLMHGDVDGTNTAEEAGELRRWLAGDAEGRAAMAALRETAERLRAGATLADPPPGLRQRIMADVRERAKGRRQGLFRLRWSPAVGSPWAPAVRYALVAGCGVVAGLLLALAVARGPAGGPDGGREYLGTLGGAPGERFAAGGATAVLKQSPAGGRLVVELAVVSTTAEPVPVRLTLTAAGDTLFARGLEAPARR